jgi:AraC-like DNA-binding protein
MWQSWNTAQTSRNRVDFWSDVVVRGVLHAEMHSPDRHDFTGALASRDTGEARLVSFKTAAHRVHRTAVQARRGEALVMVSLQCGGVSHIQQNDRQVVLQRGGIAILDSAAPFDIEFPSSVERRLVLLPRRLAAPWLAVTRNGPVLMPARGACATLARQSILQLTDPSGRWSDADCDGMLDALANLLRVAFDGGSAIAPAQTLDALKCEIGSRLHRADLTPATVARAAAISVRTLHRMFAANGQSFSRYIQRERLERIRRALEKTEAADQTLTEIALAHGFNDAAHFSRSYRAMFGETPRQTRVRAKAATVTPA